MKKIAIVGAGYVGLVTGACFASKDKFVIIVERDEKKVEKLLRGEVPFYEPGLDLLVQKAISDQKLIFVKTISEALAQNPQVIFSCVGTPPKEDGSSDLSYVYSVASEIGKNINDYILVINKSTVPVGTVAKVNEIINLEIRNRDLSVDFEVVSNPEFLKEGDAVSDFLNPDRIVVGLKTIKAETILRNLYKPFLKNSNQFMVMNPESSELTKYASNAMLATRISFINQLALFADKVGADIFDVKSGMGSDGRIGGSFLNAGIGYGGSCFPKDVQALVSMGKEHKQPMSLVEEVEIINNKQRILFVEQIINYYGKNLKNKKIGILGLAFKPETDDIRCAPSVDVISKLLEYEAKVIAYDLVAAENVKNIFGDKIIYATKASDVLENSDCLILMTEWREFLKYQPKDFLTLRDRVVFDARNCFDPIAMNLEGIKYFSIGRNSISKISDASSAVMQKTEIQEALK